MKAPIQLRSIALCVASLSVALGLTLGFSVSSGASDASGKGAERLVRSAVASPARETATGSASAMHSGCGSCTTVTTARAVENSKGGEVLLARGKPARLVSTHGCDGCTTSLGVAGFGKAKNQTVTHGCTKPALASLRCCR